MPALTPIEFTGQHAVEGYGPGFFRVFRSAVVIEADRVTPWDGLDQIALLEALAGRVDVLFLGLGAGVDVPPRDLIAHLDALGLRVEAMASATAARTYNVTLSEGRRVACALLPL
ncbi:hypothetical protein E4L95_05295 [Paracoccus liaowanqingii]|uniref:Mth938-like domain-containing protein n=1 Tax=Paracoccus liaowanqingii TaxID=2560053 RepID=A0A4Z1CQJ5_9RHOB|nr:Mth938-like domain-containing protein [Paracoccus liaowanqingii]TGN67320.1 hypothetical protein E4L95_05295 [Paracoccus liaowanqingii]